MTSTSTEVLPAVFASVDVAAAPPLPRIATGLWPRSVMWSNIAGNAAGAVILVTGWYGLSGSVPEDHGRWLAWAVSGIVACGLSNAMLILTGRFRIDRRVRAVGMHEVRVAAAEQRSGFVTAAGLTRYHDPTCQLVAGKGTEPFDPAALRPDQVTLQPCPVCGT